MATETPSHPQLDDIPDNERIGGESHPSGKPGKCDEKAREKSGSDAASVYRLADLTWTKLGSRDTGGRRIFRPAVVRRPCGGNATSTQCPLLIDRCTASMIRTSARPSAPPGSGVRLSRIALR